MVTKPSTYIPSALPGLILAKNHMVTKRIGFAGIAFSSLILAKNHMVTKLCHSQFS